MTATETPVPPPRTDRGTVLVVDDEPTIGEVVCRYLERSGYATCVAGDGATALALAQQVGPDLVVLDVMLPGIDGLEVLRRLPPGPSGRRPAVILLTARGEEQDRIAGLAAGADDYVSKPFSPAELVARVDAVLRRGAPVELPPEPLDFGALRIDPAGRRVWVDGTEIALAAREFDLLAHLARHPGRVFSRDELMDAVWRFAFYTDTSTVTVHVRRLRAKLERDPAEPRWLRTAWGAGYRFDP